MPHRARLIAPIPGRGTEENACFFLALALQLLIHVATREARRGWEGVLQTILKKVLSLADTKKSPDILISSLPLFLPKEAPGLERVEKLHQTQICWRGWVMHKRAALISHTFRKNNLLLDHRATKSRIGSYIQIYLTPKPTIPTVSQPGHFS